MNTTKVRKITSKDGRVFVKSERDIMKLRGGKWGSLNWVRKSNPKLGPFLDCSG
jgi:hypothetical protein